MKTDRILDSFLVRQYDEALALAESSDILTLSALPSEAEPPRHYVAGFACRGLVSIDSGKVQNADRFAVGISFPRDYLRRASAFEVLTWLAPAHIWHPNIRPPFICVGRVSPGMPLTDLLYQVFEIISYQKVMMKEDDALHLAACGWARQNKSLFPLDTRPLKRSSDGFHTNPVERA